jgi:HK97 gp10 family phage protein
MADKTIKGLTKVLKNLERFGDEVKEDVHIITGDNATQIELGAKNNAPVNKLIGFGGDLKQGIKAIELGKSDFKIMANATGLAPYSAYVEFGTGRSVKVPNELKEMAIKFKGKGVKEINIQPQPYLYPAFVKGRKQYLKDLKKLLKDLTKKYD